jgi:MinD-like ATPase involved in chromosome partitioning or flagellar assembly
MKVDASNGGLINYLEDPDADVENMLYDTGVPRLKLIPAADRVMATRRRST